MQGEGRCFQFPPTFSVYIFPYHIWFPIPASSFACVVAGGNFLGPQCKVPRWQSVLPTSMELQWRPRAGGLVLGRQNSRAQHFEDCKPKSSVFLADY